MKKTTKLRVECLIDEVQINIHACSYDSHLELSREIFECCQKAALTTFQAALSSQRAAEEISRLGFEQEAYHQYTPSCSEKDLKLHQDTPRVEVSIQKVVGRLVVTVS